MKTNLPKSKRLRFAVYVFHIYILLGILAMRWQVELSSLGAYVAATSLPLLGYILGDTFRKSDLTDIEK